MAFVAMATLPALLEEAITMGMTGLAPLFGVPVGAASITASANCLDVVCLHSVAVFAPMFAAWAILLHRVDFVYGRMVYLPVDCLPAARGGARCAGENDCAAPHPVFWTTRRGLVTIRFLDSAAAGRGLRPRWA